MQEKNAEGTRKIETQYEKKKILGQTESRSIQVQVYRCIHGHKYTSVGMNARTEVKA